jgi:O-antigen ligase
MAPFGFADVMLTAFAASAAALARGRSRRTAIALAGLFAVCVVWSGTRINMIALAAVAAALLLDGRGVPERTRVQVVAVGLVAVLAFAPTVLGSRLAGEDNQVSNEGHQNELTTAWGRILDRPLGAGLGAEGGVQRRLQGQADTVSGNTILAIGVQGGVLTMGAFLAFLVLCLRELETRRRRHPHDELLRASYLVLVGGIVAVSTHQGWLDLTSGTFVWAAIGLGLPEVVDA